MRTRRRGRWLLKATAPRRENVPWHILFFVQEKQELIRPVIDVSFTGLPDLTGNFRSRRHQAPESAALSMRKYIWK